MANGMSHGSSSTDWGGASSAAAYAANRHGPDGRVFLDPFLHRLIPMQCRDGRVLDAGCGAGPWSLFAGQTALSVEGIDIQQAMVDAAIAAQQTHAETSRNVIFTRGDVTDLRQLQDERFDVVLSINVGCNMEMRALYRHFREIQRILLPGGSAIVTAPNSLDVLFTQGKQGTEAVRAELQELLARDQSREALFFELKGWNHVLRATMCICSDSDKLRLITPGEMLAPGTRIFRKIPGLVVPNNFHTVADYVLAAEASRGVSDEPSFMRLVESYESTLLTVAEESGTAVPLDSCFGEGYHKAPAFFVGVFRKEA